MTLQKQNKTFLVVIFLKPHTQSEMCIRIHTHTCMYDTLSLSLSLSLTPTHTLSRARALFLSPSPHRQPHQINSAPPTHAYTRYNYTIQLHDTITLSFSLARSLITSLSLITVSLSLSLSLSPAAHRHPQQTHAALPSLHMWPAVYIEGGGGRGGKQRGNTGSGRCVRL